MQVLNDLNLQARSKSTLAAAKAWAKRLCWRRALARLRQAYEWILGALRKNEPLLRLLFRILKICLYISANS